MHAIRQYEHGDPDVLRYEQLDDLSPASGQVRIAVEACGVHLVDTTIRRGGPDLPPHFRVPLPMTPGREVAGTVDSVGPDVDAIWLGRRVVGHLGAANGGYADQAVAPVESLHVVPDGISAVLAVAAIGTGRTATAILDHAPIGPDDVVLVVSASGGLGTLLVQAARAAGAVVVGLAGGPEKVGFVRDQGADHAVDYHQQDWDEAVLRLLEGTRPTVVFDGSGGEVGHAAFALLAPGGVLYHYGGEDETSYVDPERTAHFLLGPQLMSRPGGLRSLETESLALAAGGSRVPLIGSTFALEDAAEAHRALEGRRTHGKVVLLPQ